MSHIRQKICSNLVGDGTHALVVDKARVGRGSGDDDLGSVEDSVVAELVIVDQASLLVQAVGEGLEVLGHHRDLLVRQLVAVGEMAAMRKVETHDALMSVEEGRVSVKVGRRARKSCKPSVSYPRKAIDDYLR